MKPRRKKLVRADFENLLLKNERRIQIIAENSYKLRQMIEFLDSLEKKEAAAEVPADLEAAITNEERNDGEPAPGGSN